ncbi:MAG TPA: uroporphyrinogen decarboxylase family protein [Prolixibacteraceae bacterium]|nr:uroporphyrinogen decarboxylase family protein [Prolixibacteraceae bacterium]
MKGKNLIFDAFACKTTKRQPWVPFVGVHGAFLINKNADEYLQSSKLIVAAANKAIELYQPDGIPVTFDLQIEAEILGCNLKWDKQNPPAVISHPLAEGQTIEQLHIPTKHEGRIPLVLDATAALRSQHPNIALYGLITGPFTLALHLLGTDAFLMMFTDPEKLHQVMLFTEKVAIAMASYYLDAGADIIAVVDPMTSQIDCDSFTTFVSPYCSELFKSIKTKQGKSSFFVCGNAMQNIEAMCLCGPDNISIDENIPLDYVRDIALNNNVSFGGNLKLTVSLLMGSADDAGRDALECMQTGGNKGFILAPGCDLAFSTPPENLIAVSELVHDEYKRELLRLKKIEKGKYKATDISERYSNEKVIIDIITLDSSSCAPCQYMVEAVKNAVNSLNLNDKVEYYEFRIKDRKGIEMMMALGVQNLPTICINGKVEFISVIPPKDHLMNRICEYYKQ